MEISDSDDNSFAVDETLSRPKRNSSKRARGVNYDSDVRRFFYDIPTGAVVKLSYWIETYVLLPELELVKSNFNIEMSCGRPVHKKISF